MVWVKISTLLRLAELRCHGYNNKHVVRERFWSYFKKKKKKTLTVGWKRETNTHPSHPSTPTSSRWVLCRSLTVSPDFLLPPIVLATERKNVIWGHSLKRLMLSFFLEGTVWNKCISQRCRTIPLAFLCTVEYFCRHPAASQVTVPKRILKVQFFGINSAQQWLCFH